MNPDNRSIIGLILTTREDNKKTVSNSLYNLEGNTILGIISRAILDSGCITLYATVDNDAAGILNEIRRLKLNGIQEAWKRGDISALRQVIPKLGHEIAGILLITDEYPFSGTSVMQLLCHVFLENPDRIIIPIYSGRRGFPIIIPTVLNDIISKSTGSLNIDDFLHSQAGIILEQLVDDPGILRKVGSERDLPQ